MTTTHWIAWTICGFALACVLMWLDGMRRNKTAGWLTWLAIAAGGPLVWACFACFQFSAHFFQRRRFSALAQLDREGRAALKQKPTQN